MPPVSPAPTYQPPPAYQPPPVQPQRPAPAPVMKMVTRLSVTGKVVAVEGAPETYTVAKGDRLDRIAKKMGLTRKELAELNKLKAPYALKPGQELKGPAKKAKAYTVGAGDTLFAIARRFNVTAQAIADENDIGVHSALRVGLKLRLPEGYKDKGPIKTQAQVEVETPSAPLSLPPPRIRPTPAPAPYASQPAPYVSAPVAPPRPQAWTPPAPAAQPAPVRPPVASPVPPARSAQAPMTPPPTAPVTGGPPTSGAFSDSQISQLGRGRFIWPLKGDLISTFGPKGTGQRNDGVNIRANPTDSVRAAAAGDVVYAGDQVPGFGNLVLVKHADGWVTAYGHLARVDVKMQQRVAQGQQIGMAGSTGGVGETQLHFEVRFAPTAADRARPIDPILVLPK
jgi:murein DD-endopeptidase MepM/ murein hydrolase activator NlpD